MKGGGGPWASRISLPSPFHLALHQIDLSSPLSLSLSSPFPPLHEILRPPRLYSPLFSARSILREQVTDCHHTFSLITMKCDCSDERSFFPCCNPSSCQSSHRPGESASSSPLSSDRCSPLSPWHNGHNSTLAGNKTMEQKQEMLLSQTQNPRHQRWNPINDRLSCLNEQRKRSRKLLTIEQTKVLEAILEKTVYPSTSLREAIARQLGIAPRKVQIWFQNKRQGRRKSPASSFIEEKSCLASIVGMDASSPRPEDEQQQQQQQQQQNLLHSAGQQVFNLQNRHHSVSKQRRAPLSAPAADSRFGSSARVKSILLNAPCAYHQHDGVQTAPHGDGGEDVLNCAGHQEDYVAMMLKPQLESSTVPKREVLFSPARQNSISCKAPWSTTVIRPRPSLLALTIPLRDHFACNHSVAAVNISHSDPCGEQKGATSQRTSWSAMSPSSSSLSSLSSTSSPSYSAITPVFPDDVLGRQHIEAGVLLLSSDNEQEGKRRESSERDASLLLAPIASANWNTNERHVVLPSISELMRR